MYKEWIIILIVIILVVGMDTVSYRYTENTTQMMVKELNNLRKSLAKKEAKELQQQMETIKEEWKKKYDVMAYYIEHNELEKVSTELTKLAANIDIKEYKECIVQLDTTIFILEHIQEKEKFDWRSIF